MVFDRTYLVLDTSADNLRLILDELLSHKLKHTLQLILHISRLIATTQSLKIPPLRQTLKPHKPFELLTL
jgi:hypothetical protein